MGVKRFRAFLDRYTLGNRPPTGPLTTQEHDKAESLRQATLAEENERNEAERGEPGESPDDDSAGQSPPGKPAQGA
jgi:hypothetical protein